MILSTISLAFILLFSVEYLPESGRKTPNNLEGLPLVCMILYLIIVQLLEYIYGGLSCYTQLGYFLKNEVFMFLEF
jgi:hypothetical protein